MTLILLAFFFGLGAIIASFVGVIAERIHTGQSWWKGRSQCNSCRRALNALDLVPIVSWLAARGRCRTCRSKLPVTYLVIEAAVGTVFAASYAAIGLTPLLGVFLLALSFLTFVVLYDLRHTIVPLSGSYPLLALSVLAAYLAVPTLAPFGLALVVAGCIGAAFFLLFFLSGGRAMGLGDAPIAAALALLVAPHALAGLLFSFWIGAVVGVVILVFRRGGPRMGIEVPFVPFMAIGFLLAYFTQWNPLPFFGI